MQRVQVSAVVLATLGPAACGNNDVTRSVLFETDPASGVAEARGEPILLGSMTGADLREDAAPLILATFESGDEADSIVTTLTREGSDGTADLWSAPEGLRMAFSAGVVSGAEGEGADLLATEPGLGVRDLADVGSYVRAYTHGARDGMVKVTAYDCTMAAAGAERIDILDAAHDTTRLVETCSGPDGHSFENAYWLGDDGFLWQSRQWLSAELGSVGLQRLIR